jgi:hypothetical protein
MFQEKLLARNASKDMKSNFNYSFLSHDMETLMSFKPEGVSKNLIEEVWLEMTDFAILEDKLSICGL